MAFVQNSSNYTRDSFKLDPRSKLLMLFLVSFLVFLINNFFIMLLIINVILILAILSNVNWKKLYQFIKPTFILVPTIFLLQILFSREISGNHLSISIEFGLLADFYRMNFVDLKINQLSLERAVNSCLRIVILAIASCLYSLTTNSNDYLQSLTKIGVPFELAFTTGLVIYFLPMVITETTETQMALEIRGLSINKGTFRDRFKCFKILTTTILINFIEKSKYHAIALDSRGFQHSKKRTYYRKVKFRIIDVFSSIIAITIFVILCYALRAEIRIFFQLFSS